jgi:hypothetical protein
VVFGDANPLCGALTATPLALERAAHDDRELVHQLGVGRRATGHREDLAVVEFASLVGDRIEREVVLVADATVGLRKAHCAPLCRP